MEAWDTIAAIEDGIGRLVAGGGPRAREDLFVVTHRLKGAASLHGFPRVATLAERIEEALARLPEGGGAADGAIAEIAALLEAVKAALDGTETPLEADPLRRRLAAFFAGSDDVVEYFAPEAAEHLEAVTGALLAIERDGPSDAGLAALFRAVHTLKGAAYVVGCAPVGALAHGVEDLLVAVRERGLPFTPAALDTVLTSVDVLKVMLDPAADGALDITAAEARVRERLAEALAEAPAEAPPRPIAVPPLPRPAPAAPTPRPGRQTIRVALERLDSLMDLVGELVVARSALERRLGEMDRLGEALFTSRARLGQVVADFERRRLDAHLPSRGRREGEGGDLVALARSVAEAFAELEFDRYDDFTLFAKSVAEIASDIAEVHAELTGLGRTVRDDVALVHRLTGQVRAGLGRARLVPIGSLYTRFVRQGQEAARAAGKSVRIETHGEAVELDASVIEHIVDPLLHLVQNAVVHGIEAPDERRACGKPPVGTVRLEAAHRGGFVVVEVADDGRGIDADVLRRRAVAQGFVAAEAAAALSDRQALELIFRPGFSTASAVTTAAGRGVGMDVVRTNVGRLNGEVDVETEPGGGTRLRLRLPLTVLVTEALLVRVAGEALAVPLNAVHVIATVASSDLRPGPGGEAARVEDRWLPLVRLDRALGFAAPPPADRPVVVALRGGAGLFACAVEQVLHKEEIVVKPLGAFLDGIGPYAGATIGADGRVTLLLDPVRLGELATAGVAAPAAPAAARAAGPAGRRRVLLVDDSISVRKFVGQMLEKAGFEVTTANDGAEALARLAEREFEVVVTDLEMPRVNGYELLEDVRRRPVTRDLPVVVLTTRSGDKHRDLAQRLGVSHYVTKPVAEEAFVRLIDSLVPAGAPSGTGGGR
jgi:chemosensory pili system protein ChpA (sensor histidine kinase/response regulator)